MTVTVDPYSPSLGPAKRHRVRVVLALAAAAGLVAAACGGNNSSRSSGPGTSAVPSTAGAAVASSAPTTMAPATTSSSPDLESSLRTSLEAVVEKSTVPSAIVLVRSGRSGDMTFTFGTTELGGTTPVTTADRGRVGSVTKTMTATVILQLVQEGLLTLDDPASTFVANVPDGDNITIAQLLDMRSGLYSYTDDPGFLRAIEAEPMRVWTPRELLDISFAHPADFAPGSNWNYTNTNYILLGVIMEQVTGQSAPELFQRRLFDPLGMQDTFLPALEDASVPEPVVHGYHYGSLDQALSPEQQAEAAAGTLRPADVTFDNPSYGWTAGSVVSTPEDLVTWVDALVDGTLLDATTQQLRLDSLQELGPDYPQATGIYQYGYGIDKTGSYYGHGGQIRGYNTSMARDPATDTSIVVLATLTLAPDGTPVAPTLLNTVIDALSSAS
jgi:D-alanyl-D-alanine carboxypeptidase